MIVDLEDPEDMHDTPSSRPRTTNQEGEFVAARGGDEDLVRRSTPTTSGQFTTQTGGQQRPPHASDPCLIERQGEPHQADRSRSSSKNWNADSQKFQDVEQSSAKPRDEYRPASAQSDENQDDKIIDSTSSLEREPRRQFRTQIHHDIPDRENFQGQQTGLRQLPSVSSLGAQEEADPILDPPPPLAQKLAQDPSSSQVSLPSDVGDSLPRYLGGRNWPRGGSNHLQSPLAQREAIQSQPERPPVRHNGRPSSTPRLLSPLSPQHDLSRRPEQSSSPRDRASHRISSSPMEKLKNVGRFRRISMGSNPPDFKTGQSPKTPFDRLAGFLGRQHRKSGPPEQVPPSPDNRSSRPHLVPAPPQPDSRVASPSISSFDNHERPVSLPNGRNTFNGQQPPPEGYFAHETPESFSAAQPHPHLRGTASAERMRLSDPTPLDPARLSPHHSPPYPSPPTPRRQPHVSSPRFSSPMPSPSPRTPPSRGRSEERTYAEELHLRSRSPKAFAPRPEERNLPKHDPTDPAFRLGAFRSSNPRTSRVGDQELPWKITIPGDSDETTLDPSASWRQETEGVLNGTRLPTYQEDAQEHGQHQYPQDEKRSPPPPNPRASLTDAPPPPPPHPTRPEHPHRPPARAMNSFDTPVELPVRADDDSSEEIMMSSTAYPGQEWRPAGYSGWGDQ
ncbi:uncharacterized protein BJX67DRAFT_381324 [Aspergillus lucknowensis]|uniref:Uncharacterized protein n=1 Tax=Aspergillus lucknowensis TaxID=176173 RepID=A0ABR4LR34_9EURO